MDLTHYMSLLMDNQPWNIIIFMAIPVICAETLTITEFFIIFNKTKKGRIRTLNKIIGIFDGFYFTGIFIYLFFNVAVPLTINGGWHTWIDVVAVGFYLIGFIFLLPVALLELGLIFKNKTVEEKMKIHFMLIGGFLVVNHIAMIFGMIDPQIINNMSSMPNM